MDNESEDVVNISSVCCIILIVNRNVEEIRLSVLSKSGRPKAEKIPGKIYNITFNI